MIYSKYLSYDMLNIRQYISQKLRELLSKSTETLHALQTSYSKGGPQSAVLTSKKCRILFVSLFVF